MDTNNINASVPHYAVVFRTHFWDEFTDRQLRRLRSKVHLGDLFVLVDETRGHVTGITSDKVFGLTDEQILSAGYVRAGEGSIQWFSGDVPLYMFQNAYPGYEYYVQIEYDAIINVDLDQVMGDVARNKTDIVALRENEEDKTWHWHSTCTGFYHPSEVTHLLVCLSIFSHKALQQLSAKRLEQAAQFKGGGVTQWPHCEGFIGTEAKKQNLKITGLDAFGDVGAYRWWPPYAEREAFRLRHHAFIHPVLEQSRFVPSVLRNGFKPSIKRLLLPNSWVHERLRKLGPIGYVRALLSKPFRASLDSALKRRFAAASD